MQSLIIVLAALVGIAAGQAMINLEFEFFNRFGNIKAKQACFGMDQATEQHRRVDAAIQKCFPKFRTPEVSPANGPEGLFTLFRKRRSIRYPSDFVSSLSKNINVEVDYFRCVVTEMGITDSNNNLDLNQLVANVQAMDIATGLKQDLVHAVTECRKYALCIPEGKDAYPLPNDVIRTQHYLFCETELRNLACVKNDVRYIVDQFNLKGADGRLDHVSKDSDKVAALLFANTVVGPDDFGLYE